MCIQRGADSARFEHPHDVDRARACAAAREVGDLVPAARAVGDDQRVRRRGAHRRQQRRARPSAPKRRSARRRSRSCRPSRSSSISIELDGEAGHEAAAPSASAPTASNAFWWQCAVQQRARLRQRARARSRKRPARCSRARNSSIRNALFRRGAARRRRDPSPGTRRAATSRHDGSRPTIAAPRSTCGAAPRPRAALRASPHRRVPRRDTSARSTAAARARRPSDRRARRATR